MAQTGINAGERDMSVEFLDHININTKKLDECITFYSEIIGLENGFRPDIPLPGAWMCDHIRIKPTGTATPADIGTIIARIIATKCEGALETTCEEGVH